MIVVIYPLVVFFVLRFLSRSDVFHTGKVDQSGNKQWCSSINFHAETNTKVCLCCLRFQMVGMHGDIRLSCLRLNGGLSEIQLVAWIVLDIWWLCTLPIDCNVFYSIAVDFCGHLLSWFDSSNMWCRLGFICYVLKSLFAFCMIYPHSFIHHLTWFNLIGLVLLLLSYTSSER